MLEVDTVIYLIAHISIQAVQLWLRIQKEQEELDRQTERKMDLLNTLTIDSGSDAMRDQFTKLINDNSFIVFIVFGNDDAGINGDARTCVAARRLGSHSDSR